MEDARKDRGAYTLLYRGPQNIVATDNSAKMVFIIFAILALIVDGVGMAVVVHRAIVFVKYKEIVTEYDWLVLGLAAIVFLWKAMTQGTGLFLIASQNETALKGLNIYFGISLLISVLSDALLIALPLYVLLTASPDFRDIVKFFALVFLAFEVINLLFTVVSLIALLKYINRVGQEHSYVCGSASVDAQLFGLNPQ